VGGVIHPSHRAIFGRCVTVLAATTWWCCLILSSLRGIGIASDRTEGTLGPRGVSATCLLLSEWARLAESDLSPFLPRVRTEERSCYAARCVVKAERWGRGQPCLSAWSMST
jgi:hypothetical protein